MIPSMGYEDTEYEIVVIQSMVWTRYEVWYRYDIEYGIDEIRSMLYM